MKRLFLALCLCGAMLGMVAIPATAGAATSHHVSAAKLRADKKHAIKLIRALKSHKAHLSQTFLSDRTFSALYNERACGDMFTAAGFWNHGVFPPSYRDCPYEETEIYTDVQTATKYGLQELCPDYGINIDENFVPQDLSYTGGNAGNGCDYADTYWIQEPNGQYFGLFAYEG